PRGFGFVVLEKPDALIDWGLRGGANRQIQTSVDAMLDLLKRYSPHIVAIEDCRIKSCRRGTRSRALLDQIAKVTARQVALRRISRQRLRKTFDLTSQMTKYDLAERVERQFPELEPFRPRRRKPWDSEDSRMSIFEAAALATTVQR